MRGLLVIEPLYHQIIAGNKTQTRRSGGLDAVNIAPDEWEETASEIVRVGKGLTGIDSITFTTAFSVPEFIVCKPRYKVGEVLYLKEPSAIFNLWSGSVRLYKYRFKDDDKGVKWENKLFMGAKDARAFILITNIRCERLLDISVEDCIAEGIERFLPNGTVSWKAYMPIKVGGGFINWTTEPKESFLSLFKFANKMKSNAPTGNPWVWVYEFEYLPDYKFNP